MRIATYDLEIKKAITSRGEIEIEGIEYCAGWHDHANMGISCIGAWDSKTDSPRVYLTDNLIEFQRLINNADVLVSYNGIPFDNHLLRANGFKIEDAKCYDLLREIWLASGLPPTFNYKTHGGFGLDAVCDANFGSRKSGNGALAPVLWQRGNIGEVIDYCLNDIRMTKQLFDFVISGKPIKCPKTGKPLQLRVPQQ